MKGIVQWSSKHIQYTLILVSEIKLNFVVPQIKCQECRPIGLRGTTCEAESAPRGSTLNVHEHVDKKTNDWAHVCPV